jgi:F-type H+-transporting ATPase subunit b|uniref:ATP synthase subunit b n=1 Tax=uncultured Aquificaceae bacterium TaxID=374108 RepID=A0A146JBP6_9AQUI|nr:putative ATP synthase F0 subunit beta [uncultured Aquificaceae bacterium]
MKKDLLMSLFVIGVSFASEGGEESGVLFWKAVNTVILIGIIAYFGGKYIKKFLNDRRESVANMVLEAQKAKEDSIKALEEAKRRLEEANYKLEEGIKIAKETAENERKHAIDQANEIAERIKSQAKETINIEIKRAELKLKKYATQKAIEVAQNLLNQKVDSQTSKTIIDKTIKGLEA